MIIFAPWRGSRLWRSMAHVSLDWLMGAIEASAVIVLLSLAAGLLPLVVVIVPLGWLLFTVSAGLGAVERSRAAVLLDLAVPDPHGHLHATTRWGRLRERVSSPSRWREILYLTLILPVLAVLGLVAASLWGASLVMLALPFYVHALAGGQAHFGLFVVSPGAAAIAAAGAGLIGLVLVAPWATMAAAAVDRRAIARWLGPSDRTAVAEQVRQLEARRGAAVDSAESERRRIERDLHDGAQQRLVALAMSLGRAREQFDRDPDHARDLLADAHDEAKAALTELRELVRGIHPAVLADRGLDAALSAVVARLPLPVDLDIRVDPRPPAPVESAAYFIVTEALSNAVRHADASRLGVDITRFGNRLVLRISDDGRGGADPALGTGLAGLAHRVDSLGGWLRIVSPAGGPTTVMAELPMRIVIAEDSVLLQAGLVRLLDEAGETVVAAVGDALSLVEAIGRHQPDVAIVDVRMPPDLTDDGLRAAIEIRRRWPAVGVLVLSQYVEEAYATDLLAGGTERLGYLLKDRVADVGEFVDAVRRVGAGGTALDPEVVAQLLARSRRRDPLERLSARERDVLGLMAEGRTNQAIAKALIVSDGAVEKHVTNIFTKLDLPPTEHDHRRVLAVLQWLQP